MDPKIPRPDGGPDRAAWSHYWASVPPHARGCLPGLPADVAEPFEARWRAFFRRLPAGASVLDVGTGSGVVLRLAAHARDDLSLLGVDYAEHLPVTAPGIEFLSGVDFEALPQPDHSFDAVCSQFALEYAGPTAVTEMLRVLRPEGALMVVAHHADSPILSQNRRRLAAIDALMSDGGLLQAVEGVIRQGRPADRSATQGLATILQALRAEHSGQSVIEDISALAARLMKQPDALAQLKQLSSGAEMERLRLRALAKAALDEGAAVALAQSLSRAERPVRCAPLWAAVPDQPMAWHLEGWPV
jgi:SAM-dependent methyltransferase